VIFTDQELQEIKESKLPFLIQVRDKVKSTVESMVERRNAKSENIVLLKGSPDIIARVISDYIEGQLLARWLVGERDK
jgi:hypothetical protein